MIKLPYLAFLLGMCIAPMCAAQEVSAAVRSELSPGGSLRVGLNLTNTATVTKDPTTGELYLDEHGPSLRALYDLGDPSQPRFMQSTGQSGLFFSPLYRSFVGSWADVRYLPLWGQGEPARRLLVLPKGN